MTNEEKQVLIADCKASIARIEKSLPHWEHSYYTRPYLESELTRQKIALAALSAQPVKLPKRHSMLVKPDFREGYQSCMAFRVDDVIAAIRAAGYEVQK